MKTDLLPESTCPTCGYKMDSASCSEDRLARPTPGDFSLCLKCGEVFRFNEDLILEVFDLSKEALSIHPDTFGELHRGQTLIRKMKLIP